jgi:hypothetical protein
MPKNRNGFLKKIDRYFIYLLMLLSVLMLLVCGCGNYDDEKNKDKGGDISFAPVIVPSNDEYKAMVTASTTVTIDGETYPIEYLSILKSGDRIGNEVFGQIVDQDNQSVYQKDGTPLISSATDFTSMLEVDFEETSHLYTITNFESLPGAMYLTMFGQISDTGLLSPAETDNISFQKDGGLWRPSGGSVTPWETHLSGEKHEPDARKFQEAQSLTEIDPNIIQMLRYFDKRDSLDLDTIKTLFNPYLYGHPVEVAIDIDGGINADKRYALGRFSVEKAYVMPDKKTVYMSDSNSNGGLFLFVADEKENLSSGNLFAAKWKQEDRYDGGSADIEWIELGHATEKEIRAIVGQRIRFTDIFNVGQFDQTTNTCPEGFTSVNTGESGPECLQVRVGMEVVASRLETRRYAAMLGATTEFSALAGIAYDPDGSLYMAANQVNKGMEDNMNNDSIDERYDRGGENHIQLPYNSCGCIYGLKLKKSDKVGSDYAADNMFSELCGETRDYGPNDLYHGNTCDVDNIANPNNLTFIPGYRTLVIGEVSESEEGHLNDAVWTYHVKEGQLTRIQTAPTWGKSTSPYFYPDIGGYSYLMSIIQSTDKKTDPNVDTEGIVGFIGPMPKFD